MISGTVSIATRSTSIRWRTRSIPLLISTGSESPVLEVAAAKELARLLPAARLERLDGTGHIPHRTHPERLRRRSDRVHRGVTAAASIAGGVA